MNAGIRVKIKHAAADFQVRIVRKGVLPHAYGVALKDLRRLDGQLRFLEVDLRNRDDVGVVGQHLVQVMNEVAPLGHRHVAIQIQRDRRRVIRGNLGQDLRHGVVLQRPTEPLNVPLVCPDDDHVRVGHHVGAVIHLLSQVQKVVMLQLLAHEVALAVVQLEIAPAPDFVGSEENAAAHHERDDYLHPERPLGHSFLE